MFGENDGTKVREGVPQTTQCPSKGPLGKDSPPQHHHPDLLRVVGKVLHTPGCPGAEIRACQDPFYLPPKEIAFEEARNGTVEHPRTLLTEQASPRSYLPTDTPPEGHRNPATDKGQQVLMERSSREKDPGPISTER